MVFISNGRTYEPQAIVEAILEQKLAHFIQNDQNLEAELKAVSIMMNEVEQFFEKTAVTLLPTVVHQQVWNDAQNFSKADLKCEIINFFASHRNGALLESLDAIFEELYMNAKIDAPLNSKLSEPSPRFSFSCAMNETEGMIICHDVFGSLNPHSFVRRMREVYQKGRGEAMNFESEGGAGIGCVILFEKCAGLYLGVEEDIQTVVACRLPLNMSGRRRAEIPKSLHLIYKKKNREAGE